jgi:hypothetical protein
VEIGEQTVNAAQCSRAIRRPEQAKGSKKSRSGGSGFANSLMLSAA